MEILKNPNKTFVEHMKNKLEENNGYCPCTILKGPETKCMCEDFRNMVGNKEEGLCNCRLYFVSQKTNYDDAYLDMCYKILEDEGSGVFYGDYITKVIGDTGFAKLICDDLIEICGDVNGKQIWRLKVKERKND